MADMVSLPILLISDSGTTPYLKYSGNSILLDIEWVDFTVMEKGGTDSVCWKPIDASDECLDISKHRF